VRVVLTGGGTGGHIYPGISIARYIIQKNPGTEILFIGTKKGLEIELVPKAGFKLKTIVVRGFPRGKFSMQLITAFKEVITAIWQARRILLEFSPTVVIGTGGYVCGPVVLCASLMGIPTIIHEQNVIPGITNRILSRFVKKIAVSFDESLKYFPDRRKVIVTGNPLRPEVFQTSRDEGFKVLGLDPEKKLILAFGGSRGARVINQAMIEVIKLNMQNPKIQIILITGNDQYKNVIEALTASGIDIKKCGNIIIKSYFYNMHYALAAADLIISRAGAMTVSEITALGKPAVLIPLKIAANNHQKHNALALKKYGAAEIICEDDLSGYILYNKITSLLGDEERLKRMAENSKKLGKRDSLEKIYAVIKSVTNCI